MKEINMYVRGSSVKEGSTSVVILEYNGKKKTMVYKNSPMAAHRSVLLGFLNGIAQIKEPCIINAHTHCAIGIKSPTKGVNTDLKVKLTDLISERGHVFNFNVSDDMQNHMIMLIRKTKNYKGKILYLKD